MNEQVNSIWIQKIKTQNMFSLLSQSFPTFSGEQFLLLPWQLALLLFLLWLRQANTEIWEMNPQRRMENSIRKNNSVFFRCLLAHLLQGSSSLVFTHFWGWSSSHTAKEWGSCCSPALPGKGIVAVTPLTPQSPSLLIWAIPSCSAHCPACSHPPNEQNPCQWAPSSRMLPGKWVTIHLHLHQHRDPSTSTEGLGAKPQALHLLFSVLPQEPRCF